MKKYINVLLVNAGILAVLVIVLEIVLRVVNYGPGTQPLDQDPIYHHVHPRDYSFTPYDPLHGEYGGHKVHYDNDGRRVRSATDVKDVEKKEIWFLGDSYTEAMQVTYDSSYVGRLQQQLSDSITCVNYGNASYSPLIHTIILRNALKTSKPTSVYIQVYSNDVADDEMYTKQSSFVDGVPHACNGGDPNSLISKLRRSYLARNLRRIYWTLKYINHKRDGDLTFRHHVEHSPNISKDIPFGQYVIAIDSILQVYDIPHYFFAIPSKYACYSGDWESNSFDKTFNSFAQEEGLPFVDVRPYFKMAKNPEKAFFYRDIHLTSKGNKVLAESLLDHISKN